MHTGGGRNGIFPVFVDLWSELDGLEWETEPRVAMDSNFLSLGTKKIAVFHFKRQFIFHIFPILV